MKNQRIKQVVVLETTPEELRKIAEILDRKWDRARLGDDVPSYTIFERDGLEVEIRVDQDEMRKIRDFGRDVYQA